MQRSRILSLAILVLLLTTVVGIRLVQLQALEWRQHALRASSMHRSVRYIPGPRGEILDNQGILLAGDVPVIRATFLLSELEPVRWVARRGAPSGCESMTAASAARNPVPPRRLRSTRRAPPAGRRELPHARRRHRPRLRLCRCRRRCCKRHRWHCARRISRGQQRFSEMIPQCK